MAFANCQSPEKLVVDNNICGTALRFIKGVACNEETLAMEVIKAAGRDAQEYLTSSHTMKWFKKELFFPTDIIHRRSIREGEREDSTWERAKAEVTDRLDKFIPVSLPEDKIKEIMRIMQSYAGSKGVDVLPHVGDWVG
jgi:trimethylamine--corrinoid protein Co-methyltransferase